MHNLPPLRGAFLHAEKEKMPVAALWRVKGKKESRFLKCRFDLVFLPSPSIGISDRVEGSPACVCTCLGRRSAVCTPSQLSSDIALFRGGGCCLSRRRRRRRGGRPLYSVANCGSSTKKAAFFHRPAIVGERFNDSSSFLVLFVRPRSSFLGLAVWPRYGRPQNRTAAAAIMI